MAGFLSPDGSLTTVSVLFVLPVTCRETLKGVGHGSVQQLKGGSVIKGTGRLELLLSQNIIHVIFQSRDPMMLQWERGKALGNHGLMEWFGF